MKILFLDRSGKLGGAELSLLDLANPGNILQLAEMIDRCFQQPDLTKKIAQAGKISAIQRFNLSAIEQQIDDLLCQKINRAC